MPYNPLANPYIVNPKELPSNQVAASQVPAVNIGTANQWAQSPFFLPNWADATGTPGTPGAQAQSPVATASVAWPDALVNDRDVNANQTLNIEKTRQTAAQTAATAAITAINNLTGGAPGVNSISPSTAVHAVATPVTIQGSGFTGATAVTVGGVACTALTIVNDGEITCTTGTTTTAGAANVVVTTPAGVGTGVGLMTFT